jgi:N-acylglucosamine-6-phosphate 2-epimerase
VSPDQHARNVRGLFVSCQARKGSPMTGAAVMTAMAQACVAAGATGIRANGYDDVHAIRAAVDVPIIGINKAPERGPGLVYITPTVESADEVARAGADVIAVDGTTRPRPGGGSLRELIDEIHKRWGLAVMADVDSVSAGVAAREAGADLVATTLSGYTTETNADPHSGPDLQLVEDLVATLDCHVVAEGRYRTPADMRAALALGATAVVVGTAITNPGAIAETFVRALRE